MFQLAPIGLTMFVLMAADQSGGALVRERIDGMRRICAYEDRVRGRRAPPLEVAIGMAEPCPFRYPRRPRPRPPEIPPMATLYGQSIEGGRTVCRYTYLGVRYVRPISASLTCPYTPNFPAD